MSSSLLYAALTNRLAASSLGGSSSSSGGGGSPAPDGEQAISEWESVSRASDDELEEVVSLPGTPANGSRPSSPAPASRAEGSPSKSASRSRGAGTGKVKSKTDPLRALPSEISQRIFLQLSIPSLIACSAVCRRWRRSATLNYCWFKYAQAFDPLEHTERFLTMAPPALSSTTTTSSLTTGSTSTGSAALSSSGAMDSPGGTSSATITPRSGAATWTRREARTDWKLTFAKQLRLARRELERGGYVLGPSSSSPGGGGGGGYASPSRSGYATPSRTERLASQGVLTNTERRQQQWADEAAAAAAQVAGATKVERREHYKSQGSRGGKVKGKTGKGGVKTGHDSLWD